MTKGKFIMYNKVILMGRLTRDPELRTTPNGISVATFSIAVDRRFAKAVRKGKQIFSILSHGVKPQSLFLSTFLRAGVF